MICDLFDEIFQDRWGLKLSDPERDRDWDGILFSLQPEPPSTPEEPSIGADKRRHYMPIFALKDAKDHIEPRPRSWWWHLPPNNEIWMKVSSTLLFRSRS